MIIPSGLTDSDISELSGCRHLGRFPVCIWINGENESILLRSGPHLSSRSNSPADQKFFVAIRQKTPDVFVFHENPNVPDSHTFGFPHNSLGISTLDIEDSYLKLVGLCQKFQLTEQSDWLSELEKTKWISNISQLLNISSRISQIMRSGVSVLLEEDVIGNDGKNKQKIYHLNGRDKTFC